MASFHTFGGVSWYAHASISIVAWAGLRSLPCCALWRGDVLFRLRTHFCLVEVKTYMTTWCGVDTADFIPALLLTVSKQPLNICLWPLTVRGSNIKLSADLALSKISQKELSRCISRNKDKITTMVVGEWFFTDLCLCSLEYFPKFQILAYLTTGPPDGWQFHINGKGTWKSRKMTKSW